MIMVLLAACSPSEAAIPEISTTQPAPTREIPTTTFTPPATFTPVFTSTPVATATPVLGIDSTQTRPADGMTMLYVPAGEFSMGGDILVNEQPIHPVYLDAFWIDQTQVTNGMYTKCVAAGACQQPIVLSNTRSSYFNHTNFADFPVIYVDWNDAMAYCSWAGARLPSEAEWEKAAKGTDGRTYPWGENIDSTLANYMQNVGDTTKVGSYPAGASPYGALDMAGNVYNWVYDWYDSSYYSQSPRTNPTGPTSGTERVVRGGSWSIHEFYLRSAYRARQNPDSTNFGVGFRCARSLP